MIRSTEVASVRSALSTSWSQRSTVQLLAWMKCQALQEHIHMLYLVSI